MSVSPSRVRGLSLIVEQDGILSKRDRDRPKHSQIEYAPSSGQRTLLICMLVNLLRLIQNKGANSMAALHRTT